MDRSSVYFAKDLGGEDHDHFEIQIKPMVTICMTTRTMRTKMVWSTKNSLLSFCGWDLPGLWSNNHRRSNWCTYQGDDDHDDDGHDDVDDHGDDDRLWYVTWKFWVCTFLFKRFWSFMGLNRILLIFNSKIWYWWMAFENLYFIFSLRMTMAIISQITSISKIWQLIFSISIIILECHFPNWVFQTKSINIKYWFPMTRDRFTLILKLGK